MNSIENITSKIMGDAQGYADGVRTNAEAQCRRIIDEAKESADNIYSELKEKGRKECEAVMVRAASSADVLDRNILLDAKSTKIDRAFEAAEKLLSGLAQDRYFAFLIRALSEAIENIGAAEDDGFGYELSEPDVFTVFLCEKDSSELGAALIKAAQAKAKSKGCKVVLSKENIDTLGGMIVRRGDVEVNATFEMLLKNAREKYVSEVSRILF